MSKTTWKFVMACALASSGLVAFACGGGSEEGKGTQTPSGTPSTTEAPAMSGSAAGESSAAPTASAAPAPTLPASFTAADDARKTADGKIGALTSKKGSCTALAGDLTKAAKENAAAWETWNTEYQKLDDAQKGMVQTKAPTADDIKTMLDTGTFKTCVDKKDKKMAAAIKSLTATAMKGMPGAPTTAPTGKKTDKKTDKKKKK
jgi:hypothetical protein